MVDAAGDTPNAAGALDLVGTAPLPAGFHAADAQFLYLRLRLAGDPDAGRAAAAPTPGASSSISTAIARPTSC